MLKMYQMDDKYCPMLFCDNCGEVIGDHTTGLYMWFDGFSEIYFLHKGECVWRFEQQATEVPLWDELDNFIAYLVNNINLPQ